MKADKVTRILAAARKRDALDRAIAVLAESRRAIDDARRKIGGPPSYARNRMACVVREIGAATRGRRDARGNASRLIASIARGE